MRRHLNVLTLLLIAASASADEFEDRMQKPTLGVLLVPLGDEPEVKGLRVRWPTKRGMQALAVLEGTPAHKSGIRGETEVKGETEKLGIGDIVTHIGDVQVDSIESLQEALSQLQVGEKVQVRYHHPTAAWDRRNQLRVNWQRKATKITPTTAFNVLQAQVQRILDDVSGSTVYRMKDAPADNRRKELHCWLAKNSTGRLTPVLGIKHVSEDWLFVKSYTISVGNKRFKIEPEVEIDRDNSATQTWEWCNLPAQVDKKDDVIWQTLAALREADDNVKVRYHGDTYIDDYDVPIEQLYRIRTMLDYFDAIRTDAM